LDMWEAPSKPVAARAEGRDEARDQSRFYPSEFGACL
jgi:hypothetical protein